MIEFPLCQKRDLNAAVNAFCTSKLVTFLIKIKIKGMRGGGATNNGTKQELLGWSLNIHGKFHPTET